MNNQTNAPKMRFLPNTPGHKELHRRLDKVRHDNPDLSETELTTRLWEVRDAYVREVYEKYGMTSRST